MKTKVKIGKNENVYFNGKYICNGMWLVKKEYVEIIKELQVLIDSDIKFSRRLGRNNKMEILTGDQANLPDMESIINNIGNLFIADKLSVRIKKEKTSLIPFIHYTDDKSSMVLIDENYEALTDIIPDKYITDQSIVLKTDDGDIVSVVMGCIDENNNKTKGDVDIMNKILTYN